MTRNTSPARNPVRTSARCERLIDGSSGTSCGIALTRCGALTDIRMPRSIELRRAMPTLPLARYRSPPWASFELHRLVPKAKSCFSTSTTDSPRLAASSAIPVPVIPPPMTMTSTAAPSPSAVRSVRRRAAVRALGSRMGITYGGVTHGGVTHGRITHGHRYPFNVWASSTPSASTSRMGSTICPDWIVD